MFKNKNIVKLHLEENKNTKNIKPKKCNQPGEIIIPMNNSCKVLSIPIVKEGDYVFKGTCIAKANEGYSVPIYSSVSGYVNQIKKIKTIDNQEIEAIFINNDKLDILDPNIKPINDVNIDNFINYIKESGIVGLSGASFPTWVKLNEVVTENKLIDTIIINGSECEPFITSDYQVMLYWYEYIELGIKYLKKYIKRFNNAIFKICIEDNKSKAIDLLTDYFKDKINIEIIKLKTAYPQGAKQILLYQTTNKVFKSGVRFSSYNAFIINISTVAKIGHFFKTGIPLVERIVTIDGPIVKNPINLIVPIGTPIKYLLDEINIIEKPYKIITGGPMNGKAIRSLYTPTHAATNAVIILGKENNYKENISNCIRCGQCVRSCPINIKILDIYKLLKMNDSNQKNNLLIDTGVRQCIDCGSCSYICPSRIPLLKYSKQARQHLKESERRKTIEHT